MRTCILWLLLAGSAWALEVPPTAPRTITTVATNRIQITHEPNSLLVIYQPTTTATVDLQEEVEPGKTVFSGPAGTWTILEVIRDGTSTKYNRATCVITDEDGEPVPPKPDDPDPPKPPTPPGPLPPTAYNVGPIVTQALASVSQADRLAIAKLFSDYAVSLRENRLGDIHSAMKKLAAEFPASFARAKAVYEQAMIEGWKTGKIVSITQHAGALDEIAAWLGGKQVPIMQRLLNQANGLPLNTPRMNLGPPVRVRCEMINGQRVCFDQYGNRYYGQ